MTRHVATRETNRWTGIEAVALLSGGLGVLLREPSLVLCGVVGVAFAAYARSGGPAPVALAVERELADPTPEPGETVTVTVRVRNEGAATLTDLRLVDGVPPGLAVPSPGVARHATALRPGREAVFRYDVRATRGEHVWEPLAALVRDTPGATEQELSVEAGTVLRCTPPLAATAGLPLRGLTTAYAGRVATDVAGSGVEFYATREYRPGDPRNRIDWNRWARTGELSTLEFREERAASVVLLVDTREQSYLAAAPGDRHAVERGVQAAGAAVPALLDSGDRVGLASFGPEECWLPPGAGTDQRARARSLLATHHAFAPAPSGERFFAAVTLRRLLRRLAPETQLVVFSPLADDYLATVVRRLEAAGHLVTVVSPDPTSEASTGRLLARVERRERIRRLREAGIRVVDWGDGPLATELERTARRWSQ